VLCEGNHPGDYCNGWNDCDDYPEFCSCEEAKATCQANGFDGQSECMDTNWGVDSGGDGCDWYWDNKDSCGQYDDDDFYAKDDCCVCGGGSSDDDWWEEVWEDDDSGDEDYAEDDCWDTNWGIDNGGDDCDWYWDNQDSCGEYDDDDFSAKWDCCACGGGSSGQDDWWEEDWDDTDSDWEDGGSPLVEVVVTYDHEFWDEAGDEWWHEPVDSEGDSWSLGPIQVEYDSFAAKIAAPITVAGVLAAFTMS